MTSSLHFTSAVQAQVKQELPAPAREAQALAPKPPLLVRIDDKYIQPAMPYAALGFLGVVSLPLLGCLGVMGYEALTGTTQELAFRQAYLLGNIAAGGITSAFLGLNLLADRARARFEAAKAE